MKIFFSKNHTGKKIWKLFFLMLIVIGGFAQEPVRHYDFALRKEPGLFGGEMSVSPKGSMLLATFNDFDKKVKYELINLFDGKIISGGKLDAIPYSIAWSEDEKLAAMTFKSVNPACFDVKAGMKKLFTCQAEGEVAFTRNRSLLTPNSDPLLFVLGDDMIRIYSSKGILKNSVETNDFYSASMGWFDFQNNRFVFLSSTDDELAVFSAQGKNVSNLPLTDIGIVSGKAVNPDGSKYICFGENEMILYDAGTGKTLLRQTIKDISAVCFTPDGKNILIADKKSLQLIDLTGKKIASSVLSQYYSQLAYSGYGSELVGINPGGVDIYSCKNYFPVKKAPLINETPFIKPEPPKTTKPDPPVKTKPVAVKWALPYTISEFITPLKGDSFYLYSADRKLRYYIVYNKTEVGMLWKNPYSYFQFFGFSNETKFQLGNIYIIDLSEGEAKIGSYYKSGLVKREQMIGGQNFLGKIPPINGQTISWPMKMYEEQYTLTAKVIDNIYKGKKAKCLTVTRLSEDGINETFFYQQGIGLIKIETGGKVGFER